MHVSVQPSRKGYATSLQLCLPVKPIIDPPWSSGRRLPPTSFWFGLVIHGSSKPMLAALSCRVKCTYFTMAFRVLCHHTYLSRKDMLPLFRAHWSLAGQAHLMLKGPISAFMARIQLQQPLCWNLLQHLYTLQQVLCLLERSP